MPFQPTLPINKPGERKLLEEAQMRRTTVFWTYLEMEFLAGKTSYHKYFWQQSHFIDLLGIQIIGVCCLSIVICIDNSLKGAIKQWARTKSRIYCCLMCMCGWITNQNRRISMREAAKRPNYAHRIQMIGNIYECIMQWFCMEATVKRIALQHFSGKRNGNTSTQRWECRPFVSYLFSLIEFN